MKINITNSLTFQGGDEVYCVSIRFNSLSLRHAVKHCQYLGMFYSSYVVNSGIETRCILQQ